MEKKMLKKRERGITLVALVITIIVLLILAGITINLTIGQNGIITRAQQAAKNYTQAEREEQELLGNLDEMINSLEESEDGYIEEFGVNEPKLKIGMIPVYYDGTNWRKADETNKDTTHKWYDYIDTTKKQWANIVTVADSDASLRDVAVGTIIPMDKITTFFVWIPRYAYSITEGYAQGKGEEQEGITGKIAIKFLKGNTNTDADGNTYDENYDETKLSAGATTPMIVHPGFRWGDSELTGIWVAKFEASGTNTSGQAVGNREYTTEATTPAAIAADETTYVKILPSVVSWRDINVGNAQYQSMSMKDNKTAYGWNAVVNSHLIKNSEWGAVAYLCYSEYGNVPMTNGAGTNKSYTNSSGTTSSYWCNLYTGAGPKAANDEGRYGKDTGAEFTEASHGYNTANGMLASTTGNVYGIYDMSGGAWERVAGYMDNGNEKLTQGNSSKVEYFEVDKQEKVTVTSGEKTITTYKLKEAYKNYWDKYEVSAEEKATTVKVGEETLTQGELYSAIGESYNKVKKSMADATWTKLASHKGIGANETGRNASSFYALYTDSENKTQWSWWTTDTTRGNAQTWNNDYMLLGHLSIPFVGRGGYCSSGGGAGVLYWDATNGLASNIGGFRPALAF